MLQGNNALDLLKAWKRIGLKVFHVIPAPIFIGINSSRETEGRRSERSERAHPVFYVDKNSGPRFSPGRRIRRNFFIPSLYERGTDLFLPLLKGGGMD